MTFDRNFILGDIDLSGGTTNPGKIYGKPSSTSENLTKVANQLKSDIDDGTETIIEALIDANGLGVLDVNRVKDNYKNLIDTKVNNGFTNVNSDAEIFANKQVDYIQNILKLNSIIGLQLDGKILANGAPKGYLISIDSKFNTDYSIVSSGITSFYNLLSTKEYLPSNETAPYFGFTSLAADGIGGITANSNNLLFTLFYDDLKDSTKRQQFIDTLTTNLIPSTSGNVISIVTQTTSNVTTLLDTWNTAITESFTTFKNLPEVNKYTTYNPTSSDGVSIKGQERLFNYTTSGVTDTQLTSLRELFSTVNSNNDKQFFIGKKQFN